MEILEKWWVKLLINAVLSVGLFLSILLAFATKDDGGALFCGLLTIPVQFTFFLAFDTFGSFKSKFYEYVRYGFIIIGALVALAFGIVCAVIISTYEEIGSPWMYAFFTIGTIYGVIAFLSYFIINDQAFPDFLNAFVPLASLIISYFLNVIFLYLGSSVNSFFNAYFGLILSVAVVVIMIIIIKIRHGIEFEGTGIRRAEAILTKELAAAEPKQKPKQSVYNNYDDYEKPVDNRKEASSGLWYNTLEKAVGRAVDRVRGGYYNECYCKANNLNLKWYLNKLNSSVNVRGNVDYKLTSTMSNLTENDLKDDMEKSMEKVKDDLMDKISDAIEACKREYKGYDQDWNISVELSYRLI